MLLKTPPSSLWVAWKHTSLAFHEITGDYIRGDTEQWSICLCRPPPNYFTAWLSFSSLRFLNSRILTYLNLTLYSLSLSLSSCEEEGESEATAALVSHEFMFHVQFQTRERPFFIVYVLWWAHACYFLPPPPSHCNCSLLVKLSIFSCAHNVHLWPHSLWLCAKRTFFPSLSLWLAGADAFWSTPWLFHHVRQMGNRLEAAADRWRDGCDPPQPLRHATAWGTVLSLRSKIMSQ